MGYGEGTAKSSIIDRSPSPRLPFKESVGNVNEKLERLLTKIDNFRSHLFPEQEKPNPARGDLTTSDFAEMLDYTHQLLMMCEDHLDSIRDRF